MGIAKKNIDIIKQSLVRCISTSGFIIAIAYFIYQDSVFTPTHSPFQFLISGITIGISYTSFRNQNYREGLALLLLWYFIIIVSISERHTWLFILEGTYICIIAAAVYAYLNIIRKPFIKDEIFRIVTSTVIIGIANCLIIVVLNLYSLPSIFINFPNILDIMLLNLKIGVILGLLMGIGIELANYLVNILFIQKKVAS
jgi:hypothetical protein